MTVSSYQGFFVFLLVLQICIALATTLLWTMFRRGKALEVRGVFYPLTLQLIVISQITISFFKVFDDTALVTTISIMMFPILLQIYAWRIFDLYFRWNLAGSQLFPLFC